MKRGAEVYIAGGLFNDEEDFHNSELTQLFEEAGYTVFNPKRDGIEGAKQTDVPENKLAPTIFYFDRARIRESRIFAANLNGPQVEDGTATEIGIAAESHLARREDGLKEGVEVMIAYFNDTRCLTPNMKRNPMPYALFLEEPNTVAKTREEVVEYAVKHFPPNKSPSEE